jgi:alpha-D-ribose 1-methylphosphonate 5-triphosphate synthase subunit PhnG
MTSTEIAVRDTAAITERDVVDGWITVVRDVGNLSDYIAETDFVPKALRNKPAAIAACILTGRELGIGPMASLKSIHMVQGVPSLSAEYKRARALAAGHQIVIDDSTSTRCVVRGRRAGADGWVTIQWTLDMAKRAKLAGKDVWQQYPQRMLQARATSELCDLIFPDASLGLETTEVLEDGGALVAAIAGEVAEETAAEPKPAPAPRTARRGRATTPQTASPAAAPTPPAPAGGVPLPPLPGEEEIPTSGAGDISATAQPNGELSSESSAPDDTDYDTPGTATTPQITAIWTVLSNVFKFTKDEKDQARAVCAHVVGHELASTKDMSKNEAKAVLDTLANWREVAEQHESAPREFLVQLLATEASAAEGSDG